VEPKVNTLREAELRDLLGAFALGAVDADEAAAVRAYLATNAEAREELAELMAGFDALSFTVEPMEPPAGLRDRISAAVLAERSPVPPTLAPIPLVPVAPSQPVAMPEPIRPPASFWSRATPWAAAAAALLLITAGLLFWNLQLRDQIARAPVTDIVALAPTDVAPGASGEVHYTPDRQLFVVDVRDLPPLPEGHVYEVWLIGDDETPVPAGTFDQSTDQHAIVADRGQFNLLAITAEPGPLGTEAPTGEIVATAAL
jgi:anti-sigma-K factor RskA